MDYWRSLVHTFQFWQMFTLSSINCAIGINHKKGNVRCCKPRHSLFFSSPFLIRCSLDDSASNLAVGVAGGLSHKIIRHAVNHDGSSKNIVYGKSFVIEY